MSCCKKGVLGNCNSYNLFYLKCIKMLHLQKQVPIVEKNQLYRPVHI